MENNSRKVVDRMKLVMAGGVPGFADIQTTAQVRSSC